MPKGKPDFFQFGREKVVQRFASLKKRDYLCIAFKESPGKTRTGESKEVWVSG